MSTYQHLKLSKDGQALVVHFVDRQIAGVTPFAVGQELHAMTMEEECGNVVLDFSGVDFLTSEMLGKVVVLNKRLRQKGGTLSLRGLCPQIRQVFAVTKLDLILDIQ